MPQNKFQRTIFALLTVIVTVHAYVFYSVYVIHGEQMLSLTGAANVWAAVVQLGGIFMLGRVMPVWAVVLSDWLKLVCFNFPFAFFTQLFFIQPLVRTVFKAIFVHEKQAQAV